MAGNTPEWGSFYPMGPVRGGVQEPTAPGLGGPPGHRTWVSRIPLSTLGTSAHEVTWPFAARRVAVWNPSGYDVYFNVSQVPPTLTAWDGVAPGTSWDAVSMATDAAQAVQLLVGAAAVIQPATTYPYVIVAVTEDGSPPFESNAVATVGGGPVRRVYVVPEMLPDPASGIYSVYGLSSITFQYTCRLVRVRNLAPWGLTISCIAYGRSASGAYSPISTTYDQWWVPPGQDVEIEGGAIGRITVVAQIVSIEADISATVQKMLLFDVQAFYDPVNPGVSDTPSAPIFPPNAAGIVGGAAVSVQLFQAQSLSASATSWWVVGGALGSDTTVFAGRYRSVKLLVNSSQTYSLYARPASLSAGVVGASTAEVTLASAQAATPANDLPSTGLGLDSSAPLAFSSTADTYDLVAKVGQYAGYVVRIVNGSATSATVSAWLQASE